MHAWKTRLLVDPFHLGSSAIFSHASVTLHPHTIFGSYVFVCQTITSFYSKSEHVCRVCVFLVTALNKLLTVKQY